jgi:hypothetical protein
MEKPSMVNSGQSLTLEQRRRFLKLPLEERRRQMAEQAAQMVQHFESPDEIQDRGEWQGGDIVECA